MTDSDVTAETVSRFVEQMSAGAPAPAAGSAAGVAVGMAAALAGKVARLSRRQMSDAEQVADRADVVRERALRLAHTDAEAVTRMVTGGGGATPDAIEVPREIGELAAVVQQLASGLAERGNPRLSADVAAAHHLAVGAGAVIEAIMRSNTSQGH